MAVIFSGLFLFEASLYFCQQPSGLHVSHFVYERLHLFTLASVPSVSLAQRNSIAAERGDGHPATGPEGRRTILVHQIAVERIEASAQLFQ